ncbi:MAG: hypothetical protein JWQ38_2619 [Flavipsychrobacter sp.]|nr:hypothetical protein [Flavipsychrobacter sp.]
MNAVSQRIKDFNKDLLPEMVQIKYKLMTENMFRFYRGTCHLFYEDLSKANTIPASPLTWVCGDLHLENFGSYKGDNRLVYFDLNDFDESILAPAAWELTRIVTSIFIAFTSLKIEREKALRMAQLFLKSYSATLSKGKPYYIERKTANGIVRTFLDGASKRKKKELLRKRTVKDKDTLVIHIDHPNHFEIDKFLKRELIHHITDWVIYNTDSPYNYEVVDAVFRLAGTGSVGLKRYAFLLKSVNAQGRYLLVDMKQARPSSLAPYVTIPQPQWSSEAERVVAVQQRMQNIPPALLSHSIFKDEAYLIQEMQPTKDSINFKLLKERYRDMYQVINDMAMLTASAQLRSTGRQGASIADELIAFGQDDQWQNTILEYAEQYAAKVKADYKEYLNDHKKGDFLNNKISDNEK